MLTPLIALYCISLGICIVCYGFMLYDVLNYRDILVSDAVLYVFLCITPVLNILVLICVCLQHLCKSYCNVKIVGRRKK